jgi:NADH-quinone oxidoreductase subunit L
MLMQEVASRPEIVENAVSSAAQNLWLIPAFPMIAAGIAALLKQRRRKLSATLAIGSLSLSLLLSLIAFGHVVAEWAAGAPTRETVNFTWIQVGSSNVDLGWVLDPLSAVMLVMVSFVGLLIFIYSTGYMEHDENFTRFFCFLSLFAGAMLGVVIANSLLLLFMCWELVGLTSYLLIGFWYQKPSAAAAAKKAFLTTRVGDIFFLLGMVWLFAQTGTLLFYNSGNGSMESTALQLLLSHHAGLGLTAAGAIGLLIFCGAAGKSGQLPLHVWLPDAMEGPTPVSALIHAATMVAAGVYLIARVYPLMQAGSLAGGTTTSLAVVTWVGASTALFAALVAVAQDDTSSRMRSSKRCSSSARARSFTARTKSRTFAAWAASSPTCRSPSPPTPSACWLSAAFRCCSPVSGARTAFSKRRNTGASPALRSSCSYSARCSQLFT